ncbi:MAG: lysophospholipid acyltransferase family protein [Acidimicrobiales bacterium]
MRGLSWARFPLGQPNWPSAIERPAPERNTGLDYRHDWSRRYPARLLRAMALDNLTRPLARAIAPATVRGAEYLAHLEAPVIFASNHASHLDTPLLLTTLPPRFRHRCVVAAAADYFFDRRWKAATWSLALAAIPIDRARVNRRSADVAADILAERWNLIIFPEGGRTSDGWAQEFRGGAAYLSLRSGAPVVPVYLHGTRRVLPKLDHDARSGSGGENRGRRLRRAEVVVLFGPPLRPSRGEDARRFAARIERAVDLLAAETALGWWRARSARQEAPGALHGPQAAPWRRAWALPADPTSAAKKAAWPKVRRSGAREQTTSRS